MVSRSLRVRFSSGIVTIAIAPPSKHFSKLQFVISLHCEPEPPTRTPISQRVASLQRYPCPRCTDRDGATETHDFSGAARALPLPISRGQPYPGSFQLLEATLDARE